MASGLEDLHRFSDSLRFAKEDSIKIRYNDSFKSELQSMLSEDGGFNLDLDTISKTVSVLLSKDQKLKVISWVLVNKDMEHFNHCMVLYRKDVKSNSHYSYWLKDSILPKSDSLFQQFGQEFWPGALYYQLYDFKIKKQSYYCVLGYDGKNSFNNRRIIDVLWVDQYGELHIGAPVFHENKADKKPQSRVIFEYADEATMILRFERRKKMITFSYLVPSNESAEGKSEYYIPDGRIDCYKFKRKKWIKYTDLQKLKFRN